jgi:hypothetical protein
MEKGKERKSGSGGGSDIRRTGRQTMYVVDIW